MRFGSVCTEICCSRFKFKHYLRGWATTSGKKWTYWICMQNNRWSIRGDELLTKSPIELKRNTLLCWVFLGNHSFTNLFLSFQSISWHVLALRTIDAHCGGVKLAAADRRLGGHLIWSLEKGRWPCLQQHGSRLQQCGRGRSYPTWHCCGQHSCTWKLPPESFFFSSETGAFRIFVSLQMALKQFALRAFVSLQIVSEALLPKQMTLTQFAFRSFLSLQIVSEALF